MGKISITTLHLLKEKYDQQLTKSEEILRQSLYLEGYQEGILYAIREIERLEVQQLSKLLVKTKVEASGTNA